MNKKITGVPVQDKKKVQAGLLQRCKAVVTTTIQIMQEVCHTHIQAAYAWLLNKPKWQSIPTIIVGFAIFSCMGFITFIVTFIIAIDTFTLTFSYNPGLPEETVNIVHVLQIIAKLLAVFVQHWVQLFHQCWMKASLFYGPIPLYKMYLYALYMYAEEIPNHLLALTVAWILYQAALMYYTALVLVGLLRNLKSVDFRFKWGRVLLIALLLFLGLVLFLWFPPVFGWGYPSDFVNPADPFQPIRDQICADCGDIDLEKLRIYKWVLVVFVVASPLLNIYYQLWFWPLYAANFAQVKPTGVGSTLVVILICLGLLMTLTWAISHIHLQWLMEWALDWVVNPSYASDGSPGRSWYEWFRGVPRDPTSSPATPGQSVNKQLRNMCSYAFEKVRNAQGMSPRSFGRVMADYQDCLFKKEALEDAIEASKSVATQEQKTTAEVSYGNLKLVIKSETTEETQL